VKAAVEHRTVSGLSIGYKLDKAGYKSKAGGGRDIYEIDFLKEVSVVDWPSDGAAVIDMKLAITEAADLKSCESLLRDACGLSRTDAASLVSRIKSIAHGERAAVDPDEVRRLFDQYRIG
jgi:uncharacterized protein